MSDDIERLRQDVTDAHAEKIRKRPSGWPFITANPETQGRYDEACAKEKTAKRILKTALATRPRKTT